MAKNDNTVKSYQERIDPNKEMEKHLDGLNILLSSHLQNILSIVSRDGKDLTEYKVQVESMKKQYQEMISTAEKIAEVLAPLGWIFFREAHYENYKRAAALVEENKIQEAEDLLVKSWEDHPIYKLAQYRVVGLYAQADMLGIGEARQRLIAKAFDLHKKGEYAASIPIVLAQIEGIIIDVTNDKQKLFYSPKSADHLQDQASIVGHPKGLTVLSEFMSKHINGTQLSGKLLRHGIMHGRELAYDTKINSIKAFVALLAVLEFAKFERKTSE